MIKVSITLPNNVQITLESDSEIVHEIVGPVYPLAVDVHLHDACLLTFSCYLETTYVIAKLSG